MSLPQPDPAVLRKAQRGDERAFSIILRMYETPVYNYVLRLTNGECHVFRKGLAAEVSGVSRSLLAREAVMGRVRSAVIRACAGAR